MKKLYFVVSKIKQRKRYKITLKYKNWRLLNRLRHNKRRDIPEYRVFYARYKNRLKSRLILRIVFQQIILVRILPVFKKKFLITKKSIYRNKTFESRIFILVQRLNFVTSTKSAIQLINYRYIFINGSIVKNPYLIVSIGSLISIPVYFQRIIYIWRLYKHLVFKKRNRLVKWLKRKNYNYFYKYYKNVKRIFSKKPLFKIFYKYLSYRKYFIRKKKFK